MSCFSTFSRIILGLVNILFLLLGIALIVTTAILRWGNIKELNNINGYQNIVSLAAINAIAIALLVVGGFAILLSLVGLFGVIFRNRCLLIFYEIIVLILFLVHLAALIVLLVFYPKINDAIKTVFDIQVTSINSNDGNSVENCLIMRNISTSFQCCGSDSPNDIRDTEIRRRCCSDQLNAGFNGCTKVVNDLVKRYSNYFIIIPTAIILFIELWALIMVPILVCQISSNTRYKY